MGFVRGLLVGVRCGTCAILCSGVYAQSLDKTVSSRTQLRSPSSGQWADGAPLYSTPGSTVDDVLKEMASRAAVIFTGTITTVKKGTDEDLRGAAAASAVEVDFAVDHAIRGASAGSVYTMREWAGLWRDSPRFAVGQRVLMLLHAAGPGGLSSPVDGLDGAIPIKVTTPVTSLTAQASGTNGEAVSDDSVDLRWLQAKP